MAASTQSSKPFFTDNDRSPHAARARALIAAHPEVRTLVGPNLWTFVIATFVVALQTALAGMFGWLGVGWWWLALIAAWCIGAVANHCNYVVIHEATHDLIFRGRWKNKLAGIFADLPNIIPGAMGFRLYHLKHHTSLGEYDNDLDVPSEWEVRWLGSTMLGKATWFVLFPVIQLLRLPRMPDPKLMDRWMLLSYAASAIYAGGLWTTFGGMAVIYLLASFWFSIGLHPLGGRWLQEHFTNDPEQSTSSYYGPLNVVALNIGYHNEHHDIPSIAWNRLPCLKAMAPEFYEPLRSHGSWARVVAEFVFDPRMSLDSRFKRADRTGRPRMAAEARSAPGTDQSEARKLSTVSK